MTQFTDTVLQNVTRMPKKKMHLPKDFYTKAELVTGHRWYIRYYQTNPKTDQKERFRETYSLNRIKDLAKRNSEAKKIIRDINGKLPLGWPFQEVFSKIPTQTSIGEALHLVKDKCLTSDRENTNRNIRSMVNIFCEFLVKEGLQNIPIGEFRKSHAVAFFDYALFEREISNRTYNNYKERLTTIWKELKKRKYVKKIPWQKFKKKRPSKKRRRILNEHDKELLANYIAQKDKWLTLGVLLQYYCAIRPIEMRRLRFNMFDLRLGTINLTGNETKNRDNDIVTIPKPLLLYIDQFGFNRWPQHYLLFGESGEPHPKKCCWHDLYNNRHNRILKELKNKGILHDIEGVTFYSWKDMGVKALLERNINTYDIMRHIRHKSLEATEKYCQSLYTINRKIQELDNSLLKI